MSYRDSPNYREARERLKTKARSRTDLGRYWHHLQFMTALKALLKEKHKQ